MTIAQMIRDRHRSWKDRRCMMVKRAGGYRDVSWATFYGAAREVGRGLLARGLHPGDRVAILSHTRYEWAVADTGALTAGGVTVPFYPTLTRREIRELLVRSGSRGLFVSDQGQVEKTFPLLDEVGTLEFLVAFEDAALAGVEDRRAVRLEAFCAEGRESDDAALAARLAEQGADDPATLIFTSGTTGEPKGVPLTHRNILANVEASLAHFEI